MIALTAKASHEITQPVHDRRRHMPRVVLLQQVRNQGGPAPVVASPTPTQPALTPP